MMCLSASTTAAPQNRSSPPCPRRSWANPASLREEPTNRKRSSSTSWWEAERKHKYLMCVLFWKEIKMHIRDFITKFTSRQRSYFHLNVLFFFTSKLIIFGRGLTLLKHLYIVKANCYLGLVGRWTCSDKSFKKAFRMSFALGCLISDCCLESWLSGWHSGRPCNYSQFSTEIPRVSGGQ